jgi:F0F1-type ATP synthase assembly protein I
MADQAPGGARRPDRQDDQRSHSTGAEFAGLGIQLGLTFALFALLGWWLDKRLGTGPWLLILLVFVGAAAGFYSVYRRVFPPKGDGSGGGKG